MSGTQTDGKVEYWHDGERLIQKRVGVSEIMESHAGRIFRPALHPSVQAFLGSLAYLVAGTVDDEGRAWATLLAGRPGFMSSEDPTVLKLGVRPDPQDPASGGLSAGRGIGLLGIDVATRRRNRINGEVRASEPDGLEIGVTYSYGNCPQHVKTRSSLEFYREPAENAQSAAEVHMAFTPVLRKFVESAETFFIASYVTAPDGGLHVDVSHKGGEPGFVRVREDGVVVFPDYPGNMFFNTLGNLVSNPPCGLLFVDFASGDVLQMTGRAQVILDGAEVKQIPRALHVVHFKPECLVVRPSGLPIRWGTSGAEAGTRPSLRQAFIPAGGAAGPTMTTETMNAH